ncbi:hypothetical protein STTU_0792 [Streptomyces sp. Tu6071]|nr:hypothetical protein STTU_0792 [Streptomyces sp. Tu6071]
MDWENLSALADRVAANIAREWGVVEKDDVKQEILAHAYEHRKAIEAVYPDEAFIWKIFRKAGHQYASRERDARDLLDDQYYYTPDEAKQALQSFVYTDEEIGALMGREDDLTRARVSDNISSARLDAETGLRRLPERYRGLLERHYVEGIPLTNRADSVACSRALIALSKAMNRQIRSNNLEKI